MPPGESLDGNRVKPVGRKHVGAASAQAVATEEVVPFRICSDLSDATRQFTDGHHRVALGDDTAGAVWEQRQCVWQRYTVHAEEAQKKKRLESDVRITMRDLRLYGFHPGHCLRCEDLKSGVANSWHRHIDECRWRIYNACKNASDPKFKNVEHLFQDQPPEKLQSRVEGESIDLQNSPAAKVIPPPTPVAQPNSEPTEIPLRATWSIEDLKR